MKKNKKATKVNKIQKKLSGIWSYTELEMDDFSTVGLKKHLEAISEIVNDVLFELEELKICHICGTDGYICEPCLKDMKKNI